MNLIEDYRKRLLELYPEIQAITESIAQNNNDYAQVVDVPAQVIDFLCKNQSEAVEQALKAYIRFCDTFKQKQLEFVRNQEYAYQDFDKVNAEVYQNATYMEHTYYPALLFSYLFSSNYFDILRIFRQSFLPLCKDTQGQSCEVGIGHGMLSSLLLQQNPNLLGYGIDISPIAATVTEKVTQFFKLSSPITVTIEDATQNISRTNNQLMICAEVLEHLPNPKQLLENIYQSLAPQGKFFLTASINMESVDHLYLFHSDEEVLEMVKACGFTVLERHVTFLTSQNYRHDEALQKKLMKRNNPATAVLILSK